MITTLCLTGGAIATHQGFVTGDRLTDALWIDLLSPTPEEEQHVEHLLDVELPTREEMRALEESNRLHETGGALYLTANVVVNSDGEYPRSDQMTFVLTRSCLVTMRYTAPRALGLFANRAMREPALASSGETALLGLIDTLLERLALNIERVGADLDELSHLVLSQEQQQPRARLDYRAMLRRLEFNQVLLTRVRGSLSSLERLLTFIGRPSLAFEFDRGFESRAQVLLQNTRALVDHTHFLAGNLAFELSAILGMINIEQNTTIKIFSIAAVVFLPPTLVASIYGMNFQWMPELGWRFGYSLALLAMGVSAVAT
jgi:magnesium transporter